MTKTTSKTTEFPTFDATQATDQIRAFAEKGVEQSKEAYAKLKTGAESAQKAIESTFETAKAASSERHTNGEVDNTHPTVKPVSLIRYLVRLVTPPGWPREVRPPDAPGWEHTAAAWLLDLCPPEYRGYPALRRHLVVRRARRHGSRAAAAGRQLRVRPPPLRALKLVRPRALTPPYLRSGRSPFLEVGLCS
jgi:hypothetical protein